MITEQHHIGQAFVVNGQVVLESANGVSQALKPNSPIHLDDRIDTGNNGEVSIIFTDGNTPQLDVGRMSNMVIDDDVVGATLPDLGDVAVEAGLVADLLADWEAIEPLMEIGEIAPAPLPESDDSETASVDAHSEIAGGVGDGVAADNGDDGFGSFDDDIDLSNLVPPPEDLT